MSAYSAITVEGLSKQYKVSGQVPPPGTLYEILTEVLTSPWARARSLAGHAPDRDTFWSLRDVSFQVNRGEVIGVIGRNGAGKSTLLKILSRITAPTRGRITVHGRMASLLEVGTGFHPELTGRENIYLNGAILGMRRGEIDRQFDAIVAFAEIDRFVDTPVKRYSSGMYVRLAFSVAAHLDPDVLLVDEVLAVGDAAFQKRCLGKMQDVASAGRTVIFVSHNLATIRNLCSRCLLLEAGSLRFDGPAAEAFRIYEDSFADSEGKLSERHFSGDLAKVLSFSELRLLQDGQPANMLDPMREFAIEVRGTARRDFPSLDLNVAVFKDGAYLTSCFDTEMAAGMREGEFVSRFRFDGDVFRPGRYTIALGASTPSEWVWGPDAALLNFSDNQGGRPEHRVRGAVRLPYFAERLQ
jgi:lipopolysaccharide transport system ATP-binding protein